MFQTTPIAQKGGNFRLFKVNLLCHFTAQSYIPGCTSNVEERPTQENADTRAKSALPSTHSVRGRSAKQHREFVCKLRLCYEGSSDFELAKFLLPPHTAIRINTLR